VHLTTVRNDSVIAATIDARAHTGTSTSKAARVGRTPNGRPDARALSALRAHARANNLERTGTGLFALRERRVARRAGDVAGGNEGLRVNHYREAQRPPHGCRIGGNAVSAASCRFPAADGGRRLVTVATSVKSCEDGYGGDAGLDRRAARAIQSHCQGIGGDVEDRIPGSVTDVMVGLSYPEHFALQEPRDAGMDGIDRYWLPFRRRSDQGCPSSIRAAPAGGCRIASCLT